MLAIIVSISVFIAVVLLVITLTGPARVPVGLRLSGYGYQTGGPVDLSAPITARLLGPAIASLARLVHSLSAEQIEIDIRELLARAGNPRGLDINRFLALKGAGLLLPTLILAGPHLLAGKLDLTTAGATLVLTGVGWRLPTYWLEKRAQTRQVGIGRGLPDALDLMIVCVEAGNSLEGAMSVVADRLKGPLAEEFDRTLREVSLGKLRQEALHDLARRANSSDLRTFIAALLQADQLGVGVAQVLRVQGEAMRTRRRQRAEEQAAKVPVLMLIPLVIFILPSLMIVIVGPIAIKFADFLSSGMMK